jgi:septal ring-binding cell division protein DamX
VGARISIALLWSLAWVPTAGWTDVPALQRQETGQAPRIGFLQSGTVCVLGSARAVLIAQAWAHDQAVPIRILDCSAQNFELPDIVSNWAAYWSAVERKLTEQGVDAPRVAGVITAFDVPSGGSDQVSLWTFLLEQVQRHLGRSLPGLAFGAHASPEVYCNTGNDDPVATGYYYWEAVTHAINGEDGWFEGPYLLTEGPGIVRRDGFQVDCIDFTSAGSGRPVPYEDALPGQGARKFAHEYDAWSWTLLEQEPTDAGTVSGGYVATVQGRPIEDVPETVDTDTDDNAAETAIEPTGGEQRPSTSAPPPGPPRNAEPTTTPWYDDAPEPLPTPVDNAPRNLTASGGPRVTFSWDGSGELTCDGQTVSQSVWVPEELTFGSHRCVVESAQGSSNTITLVCTASECSANAESPRASIASRMRNAVRSGNNAPPSDRSTFIRIETVPAPRQKQNTEPALTGAALILAQPDDFYTVQLMAVTSLDRLENFVRSHALTGTTIARTRVRGKTWYVLLRGFYRTDALALEASRALPRPPNEDGMWVRQLESLKRAVQRAEGLPD